MKPDEFRRHAHEMVDWMADYMEGVEAYPVRSQVRPGEIAAQLADAPPERGEPMADIFADFQEVVMPGISHWQHPRWFAFFQGNASPPSVLAEMLTATLGAQCMMWETSPAATEMEIRVTDWLRQMMGLPEGLSGVIQDTASSATFCAVLAARERATGWKANASGLSGLPPVIFYASAEAHSSVMKAVRMAGIGGENLRLIPVDASFAMRADALEAAIVSDRAAGLVPAGIVACLGTTGVGASDPLADIAAVADRHDLYLHVDAAWAGSALICPEHRHLIEGVERADSFVFNPHKWLLTNFDCSVHFVHQPEVLVRTLSILPEYLKTREGSSVTDFRDWGIQLGRRFRALKLWFVIRSYGAEGLRALIRNHVQWASELADAVTAHQDFDLVAGPNLGLIVFRYRPKVVDQAALDDLNEGLLTAINDDGRTYLTRTLVNGKVALRFNIGQTTTERRHVFEAWDAVTELAGNLRVG